MVKCDMIGRFSSVLWNYDMHENLMRTRFRSMLRCGGGRRLGLPTLAVAWSRRCGYGSFSGVSLTTPLLEDVVITQAVHGEDEQPLESVGDDEDDLGGVIVKENQIACDPGQAKQNQQGQSNAQRIDGFLAFWLL